VAPRSGIQLCYPFSEKRILSWEPPWLVQPKLDGERCRMLVEPGPQGLRCLLLSSSEELITSVPHINEAGLYLPPGEYDGELYTHGLNQNQIHSIVSRRVNQSSDYLSIQLHIFDLAIETQSQLERTSTLKKLTQWPPYLIPVQTKVCWSIKELYDFYDQAISEGYEGFVVRNLFALYIRRRATHMMKFKPKKTDIYPIWDVEEAISESGTSLSMIGAFVCRDLEGSIFRVGAGHLTHSERKLWWEEFKDTGLRRLFLEVEYQTLSTKEKVPLFSRALRVITEKEVFKSAQEGNFLLLS